LLAADEITDFLQKRRFGLGNLRSIRGTTGTGRKAKVKRMKEKSRCQVADCKESLSARSCLLKRQVCDTVESQRIPIL